MISLANSLRSSEIFVKPVQYFLMMLIIVIIKHEGYLRSTSDAVLPGLIVIYKARDMLSAGMNINETDDLQVDIKLV